MKIKLVFLFFLLGFFAIIARLFSLQVLQSHPLTQDYVNTTRVSPERGIIYDANHKILAANEITYTVCAQPKLISDKQQFINALDTVLHVGEATLSARYDDSKVWLAMARGVSNTQKMQLDAKHIPGICYEEERARYYPEASLSAHLLGFVGKNSQGDPTGYFGIEGYYDTDLTGLPGILKSEQDLLGRPIFLGTQERISSENGRNLILSIDASVQQIVKSNLIKGLQQYDVKQGCAIIADPHTMAILALSCLPDFDPNSYYDASPSSFLNTAISSAYEPGSTFKPLIVAAGIEEKVIKPDDIYDEAGPIQIGKYSIRTWDNTYEGKISVTRLLEKSSNVGMVWIGSKLGDQKVYDYIQKYGFGKPTGIDLQGEASGYIRPKSDWYPVDYATATFGQGIAVTPIQMIRALSAVINGGELLQPYVVSEIDQNGEQKIRKKTVIRRVMSEQTSAMMRTMLVAVVEHGEVNWARPAGYTFGGKTGTAQIPISGHYDASNTVASFMGFVPASNPKFIGMVILNSPHASQWGSETAAPLFFSIAKDLLVYYNILPDKPE